MQISFTLDSFDEYLQWQKEDKKTLNKINKLIVDIRRNPFDGIGKPEALKHELQGFWSRRIDDKNRLLYQIGENGDIVITKCKGHY